MPKLPARTSKQVLQTLEHHGFVIHHITGSHYIMYQTTTRIILTVPKHNRDLAKGALHSIIKESKLRREDFNTYSHGVVISLIQMITLPCSDIHPALTFFVLEFIVKALSLPSSAIANSYTLAL